MNDELEATIKLLNRCKCETCIWWGGVLILNLNL